MSVGEGLESCWCLVVDRDEWRGDGCVHIPVGKATATNQVIANVRVSPVPVGVGVPVKKALGTVSVVGQGVTLEAWACLIVHCLGCGAVLGGGSEWHFPVVADVPTNRAIAGVAFDCGWTTDGEDCWYCQGCHWFAPMCPACFVGDHGGGEGGRCDCGHAGWPGSTTKGGTSDA